MTKKSPPQNILALNSGSSSLKFSVHRVAAGESQLLLDGESEGVPGGADPLHSVTAQLMAARIDVGSVGHRVVHGGPSLRKHCMIDERVLAALYHAAVFAPLHAAPALALIDAARKRFPSVPQYACFDTAFHATMPAEATTLPVARSVTRDGLQRYGFHGLSCESIMRQLGADAPSRVVIAHLGSGCSVTAVRDGASIDTSMGLTPSGGLIMATRSGDLDPGLLIYLLREQNLGAEEMEELLDRKSGLLGVSGSSGDMRALHAAEQGDEQAALAITMFCNSVRKQIAAMTSTLGGADLLVFTGGIGEHDAAVRARICDTMEWMGIPLDSAANEAHSARISADGARCDVRVLPTRENEQIARHAYELATTARF
jgi:acetate kinase